MLILKRKRIIVMMCMFFLALYAFSFKIASYNIKAQDFFKHCESGHKIKL